MKKVLSVTLVVLLLLACCGCVSSQEPAATQPDQQETTEPTQETQVIYAPWKEDVSKLARDTGSIHYYFMASHGMFIDAEANWPLKWGDSCLIAFPNGELMLIDGGKGPMIDVLVTSLKQMGVETLDYVILTHCHKDHGNGIIEDGGVLDNFTVKNVYWNGVHNSAWQERGIEERFAQKSGGLQLLKKGDTMQIGEVSMEVLWPLEEEIDKVYTVDTDLNNTSLVLRFDYKDHSALFAGDLYTSGEELLLADCEEKLDVEFLKVPHHGAVTSSGTFFVFAVSPKVAMATGFESVATSVQNRYDGMGTKLLYDQYNGFVHVYSDGTQIAYDTMQSRKKNG